MFCMFASTYDAQVHINRIYNSCWNLVCHVALCQSSIMTLSIHEKVSNYRTKPFQTPAAAATIEHKNHPLQWPAADHDVLASDPVRMEGRVATTNNRVAQSHTSKQPKYQTHYALLSRYINSAYTIWKCIDHVCKFTKQNIVPTPIHNTATTTTTNLDTFQLMFNSSSSGWGILKMLRKKKACYGLDERNYGQDICKYNSSQLPTRPRTCGKTKMFHGTCNKQYELIWAYHISCIPSFIQNT